MAANSMKNQLASQTYALAVGEKGIDRLNLLNNVYNPYSQAFFQKLTLNKNIKILTIGCGVGIMDTWLAKQIAPYNGEIIATDISKEQLTIAKNKAKSEKITNIQFQQLDVTQLNYHDQFDLVYARFTLSHLPKPDSIIKKMAGALRKNGILWCEEMVNSRIYSIPENNAMRQAVNLVTEIGKKRNFDTDFGDKLFLSFKHAGLKHLDINIEQPIYYKNPEKSLLLLSIKEAKSHFISEKLITEKEIDLLIEALESFTSIEDHLIALTPIFQVFGTINHI